MPFKDIEARKAYNRMYYETKTKPIISLKQTNMNKLDNMPVPKTITDEPIFPLKMPQPLPHVQTDFLNLYSQFQPNRPNPFGSYNHFQPEPIKPTQFTFM
jgi:hypothetical protein